MKQSKREKKLATRIKSFDDIKQTGQGSRPGSKYVMNDHGKNVMYHKPGSLKK